MSYCGSFSSCWSYLTLTILACSNPVSAAIIPFFFQSLLDTVASVGRIAFYGTDGIKDLWEVGM